MYNVIREDIYFANKMETITNVIVSNVSFLTATQFLDSEYQEQIDIHEYDKKYIKCDKTYAKLSEYMPLKTEHIIILQVVKA